MDGLALELSAHHLLGLLRDGHKAFHKQLGNAGYEFHHRTHGDTQKQNVLEDAHHSVGGACARRQGGQVAVQVADVAPMGHRGNHRTH